MKTAEREVLKTMKEMGMIPALRAANAVYQNDRTGEITAMNTASSAFVEDKSLTPDENNVATFEELFHLDNDILLGSLQEENTVRLGRNRRRHFKLPTPRTRIGRRAR